MNPELLDAAPELSNGIHRFGQVHGREPSKASRVLRDAVGDVVIGDQRTVRSVPCAEQAERDPSGIHRGDREVGRELVGWDLLSRPAPERFEHLMPQEPQRRVLHPDIDRHRVAFSPVPVRG